MMAIYGVVRYELVTRDYKKGIKMITITSGFMDMFSVPQEGKDNMKMQEKANSIDAAIRSLINVQDPAIQQIVAQLRQFLQNG